MLESRGSQPWHECLGLGHFLCWGLPSALQVAQQHPGSPPSGRQEHNSHSPAGTTQNVFRHCQMVPGGHNGPQLRTAALSYQSPQTECGLRFYKAYTVLETRKIYFPRLL